MNIDELFEYSKEPKKRIKKEDAMHAIENIIRLCICSNTKWLIEFETLNSNITILHIFNLKTKEAIGIYNKGTSKYWHSQYYVKDYTKK